MSKWTSMLLAGVVTASVNTARPEEKDDAAADLKFPVKSIAGKHVDLSEHEGKVLLVVHVASQCGLTPQYEELEAVHEKYGKGGLAVLGFPCNQFGKQEPGSE